MATFKPVVFTTKNHIKSDGTTNIKIRIYHNKESQYIPTPYYIEPGHLNPDGNVSPFNPNAEILNYDIGNIVQAYKKICIEIGSGRTSRMSCVDLRDYILSKTRSNVDIIDFVAFSRSIISETKKKKTINWYESSLNSFTRHLGVKEIDARDITSNTIKSYIKSMMICGIGGKPMDTGAINNYLRAIRSLFNKCRDHYNNVDYDLMSIPNNPFAKVKLPQPQRKRRSLTAEDIIRIRDYQGCKTYRQRLGRDMFMLMFYLIGINVNDLFKIDGIRGGRITYERSKVQTDDNVNNFPLSVKVEPEAFEIIKSYSENGVFLSNVKNRYSDDNNFMDAINTGLKDICQELELPRVTTNWARHSWASIARNKARIPKADVDFCLGHVNNDYKMADVYIDIDYGIFDDANRKVLDLLK